MSSFNDLENIYSQESELTIGEIVERLSETQVSALCVEIESWGDEEIGRVQDVLNDYYGVKDVPASFIKSILKGNLELAYEVFTEGQRDTCVREVLGSAFLKAMGITSVWPCFGHSDEFKREFFETYAQKCKLLNFTVI